MTADELWREYTNTLDEEPVDPKIDVSMAGDQRLADVLLALYLSGKKTAGSGLVSDYDNSGDPLPEPVRYWIVLDSKREPRCILRTKRVEFHRFDQITEEIARAEGEGDLTLAYWRKAHAEFFGLTNPSSEMVVTEFFEVVYMLG